MIPPIPKVNIPITLPIKYKTIEITSKMITSIIPYMIPTVPTVFSILYKLNKKNKIKLNLKFKKINMEILYIKLTSSAIEPTLGTKGSVGFDLYSDEDTEIKSIGIVKTGIALDIPKGIYGRIAPRSSLAVKGIDVLAGVVDNDYRGEIKVVLHNIISDTSYKIKKGDKIAQMIFEKVELPVFKNANELSETIRGSGGFGSTGN